MVFLSSCQNIRKQISAFFTNSSAKDFLASAVTSVFFKQLVFQDLSLKGQNHFAHKQKMIKILK